MEESVEKLLNDYSKNATYLESWADKIRSDMRNFEEDSVQYRALLLTATMYSSEACIFRFVIDDLERILNESEASQF